MSLSLGEKLRQTREERGFTLSEVAEQTRISGIYLESIENDDYSKLPGGIFNKGFVKSFAKFVGVNEQEALADYASLISTGNSDNEMELKVYKPEVLTDDRFGSSIIPTAVAAVIILGIMSAGVYFLVNYLRPGDAPAGNLVANTNDNSNAEASNTAIENPTNLPTMGKVKVEFKAIGQPVRLVATNDGTKTDDTVSAGTSATFEPKESLTLNYNRWNAQSVELLINDKAIALPAEPLAGTIEKGRIEFTINQENIGRIWTTGAITAEVPSVTPAPETIETSASPETTNEAPAPTATATPEPRQTATATPASRPVTNANVSSAATPAPKTTKTPAPTRTPPAATPTPAKPAANNGQ
ncbi:MAG: helix-turn-helix domain-containing protein [Pyrinomonadaceae bacterium]